MPAAKETGFISLITSYAGKVKISFTGDEGYANIEEINQQFENIMNEQISKIS